MSGFVSHQINANIKPIFLNKMLQHFIDDELINFIHEALVLLLKTLKINNIVIVMSVISLYDQSYSNPIPILQNKV